MNDNRLTSLISSLFAQEREKINHPQSKVQKMLADLREKAGSVRVKSKGNKK